MNTIEYSLAANPIFSRVLDRFREIAVNFGRVLQEIHRNSLVRCNEAYGIFLGALQGTQQESQKQLQDVLHNYQSAAQEAWAKGNIPKEHEQAYRNYLELLNRTYEEAQKRHEEAVRVYTASLQQARERTQSETIEANRTYLQSLKETWGSVDVDAIVTASAQMVGVR